MYTVTSRNFTCQLTAVHCSLQSQSLTMHDVANQPNTTGADGHGHQLISHLHARQFVTLIVCHDDVS
jgi:hypothetical protein